MPEHKVEFREISTRDIHVDPLGQRDVEKRKAQFSKIMKTFDWRLAQPISVGRVDGKYWCFDGQMTMKVLKAKNGGRDCLVMCRVIEGLTMKDMADLFLAQKGITTAVTTIDKLTVKANYGDKDAIAFFRLAEKNGFKVTDSQGNRNINAVAALWGEYKAFEDDDQFDTFLRILMRAWRGDPSGSKAGILKGLGLFMRTYKGEYTEEMLVKRLASVSPLEIVRDAEADRTPGPRKYAVKIFNVYNKNRSAKMPLKL